MEAAPDLFAGGDVAAPPPILGVDLGAVAAPPAELSELERRERWLLDRRTAITGTDVAAIMGLSPFAGPIDVWLEKKGRAPQKKVTAPMVWGRRMERAILSAYAEEEGVGLEFADSFALKRWDHIPLFGATLDATRLDDARPVDAKNVRFPDAKWGEHGTDEIPLYYAAQLFLQMLVTGAQSADLAVLFTGSQYRRYTVHRDEETLAAIVDKGQAWWERYVVADVPPEDDGSPSFAAYLKDKFARATEDTIVPVTDPAIEKLGLELEAAREAFKAAEKEKERLETAIKALIGPNAGLVANSWRVTWKNNKDSASIDYKAIAHEFGSGSDEAKERLRVLMEKHATTKPGARVLRFTSLAAGGDA